MKNKNKKKRVYIVEIMKKYTHFMYKMALKIKYIISSIKE